MKLAIAVFFPNLTKSHCSLTQKTAGNTVGAKICRDQDVWEHMYISAQSYLNKYLMKMVKAKTLENLTLVGK